MKVYSVPAELPAPEPDFRNYDFDRERRREQEHQEKLKEWLREQGYTGARTGEILSEPMADGYANYMLAENARGARGILIHLPYGDGWHSPNVEHLPKKEVHRRIDARKALAEIFAKKD